MGISLAGFNSGMPVNDIINQLMQVERQPINLMQQRKSDIQKEQSRYSEIQTKTQSFLNAIKALTTTSLNKNPFKAKMAGYPAGMEDTYKKLVTATVSETASPQSIQLKVINTATNTKAVSQGDVGKLVQSGTLTTDLSQGSLKAGTFTIFVDGQANTINVAKDGTETVDDILDNIKGISGINDAQVVGGKLVLSFDAGTNVQLGASSDTSNFLKLAHLQTGTNTGTSITSSTNILLVNTSAVLSDASANLNTPLTDGTFSINGKEFDTTGKTLNQIISEINDTSGVNVTATFSYATNRLELTSKTAGSSLISLQDGTGNFLTAMGLVNGTDTTSSQTVGANASFELNGTLMSSASNTVDSSISGLTGVTLTLLKQDPGTTVTINVTNNTDDIKKLADDFVKKYNELISFIDVQTDAQNKGALVGESSILRLRNQLRQMVTERVSGMSSTPYQSLRDIGISTGAVKSVVSVKPTLELDATKFAEALADNPDAVRKLLIGTTEKEGFDGIATRLQKTLDAALLNDGTNKGMFAAYSDSVSRRIKAIDNNIDKAEERLEKKEAMYRQQFLTMERLIGQYQSQGSSLSGLSQQLSANRR